MAEDTEKSKLGNVTIATVKNRREARHMTSRLDSAGITSRIVEEDRTASPPTGRVKFSGVKVQVGRADARRALQLLRDNKGQDKSRVPLRAPARGALARLTLKPWQRAALEVIALLAGVALLAAWLY